MENDLDEEQSAQNLQDSIYTALDPQATHRLSIAYQSISIEGGCRLLDLKEAMN